MDHVIRHLPILVLNVFSRCNCRCGMCDIWRRAEGVEFGVEQMQPHWDSLQDLGVEQVVLTGGEPLMAPGVFDLCRELRARNIRVTLLSSGLLLGRFADQIIGWTNEVIVSLDGPPAIHDSIRGVEGAFHLLRSGVAAIRGLERSFPVSARCTVQRANCGRLVETVAAAREIGMGSVSFLAVDTQSDAFDHFGLVAGHPALPRVQELPVLESQIALLVEAGECGTFVRESPGKLDRIVGHFRAALGLAEPVAPACNAPWNSAVIETDGRVRPCFFHPAIGKLGNGVDLGGTLNSPQGIAFRSSLVVDANPTCRRCVCAMNHQKR
jgi:MoaA/NifB/PqqE/SkfB family radical SAM enzyme